MYTDGSRNEEGAAGYSVVWRKGQSWKGLKVHMGYNQEAYDAECAAIARALETATFRAKRHKLGAVTIFTDAQAAITRMASDEPGPGQVYAIAARKHLSTLRRLQPGVKVGIRWCSAHKGIEGNEIADGWAKQTADEPDERGVEWLRYSDRYGKRSMPLPRSLSHLKREISEAKWTEAKKWSHDGVNWKKYRPIQKQIPDPTVARSRKRLASRFYQLKTGHARTGEYLHKVKSRPFAQCWWCERRNTKQTREHLFKKCPAWKD